MKTVGKEYFENERKEALEWDLNPVKKAILILFENELREENYRTLSRDEVIQITERTFKRRGLFEVGKESRSAMRVLAKMKKSKTHDEAMIVLGEYLLQ